MQRSGYVEDMDDNWAFIRYRGAVESSIKGKRGQAFLRELIAALDAMPEKKLIAGELQEEGQYCAMGCVGAARGMDLADVDIFDYDKIAQMFGIAPSLVREIEYINDDGVFWQNGDMDAKRWQIVRDWAEEQLIKEAAS